MRSGRWKVKSGRLYIGGTLFFKMTVFSYLCTVADQQYDKLFYSIGEVVKRYNIPVSTLHYWEKEFTELKPHRNKKGNRLYTEDDILLLDTIYFLVKEKGYTIKGAKERLKADRVTQEKNARIRNSLLNIRALMMEMKESLDEAIKNQSEK